MSRVPLLASLLVVSLLASVTGPGVAAGAAAEPSVTEVAVAPDPPVPGETITLTPTVRNAAGADSYKINAVALRSARGDLREYARVEDTGTVPAGETLDVPLTVSFDNPGQRFLRVVVYGEDESGDPQRVEYPVTLDVREATPRLAVDAGDAVVGAETAVDVTVANGLDSPLRNVELTLSGVGTEQRRVTARQPTGETTTHEFAVTPERPGEHDLTATLRYETPEGRERTATRSLTLDTAPLRRTVELDASAVGEGRTETVRVSLSNQGNAPIENVTLRVSGTNASVPAVHLPRVDATSQRTVPLNVSELSGSGQFPVTVVATYESTGVSRQQTDEVELVSRPGRVRLTGIDVEREDGSLHVVGSASNLGLTAADGVVVSVLSTESVEPAYPGREYFVGTVPASDFASFDVYADAEANATAVPLEVSYLVDGREVTRRTEIPVENGAAASTAEPSGGTGGTGGGLPLGALAIGAVAVLVAGGFSYVAWRNYRDDT